MMYKVMYGPDKYTRITHKECIDATQGDEWVS